MPLDDQIPLLLDNRTHDDIRRSLQERIPRFLPEWTDYNESDPGIALLELFAWLADQLIYRINRVPKVNYLKFLQLIGMELQPPQPATVHLTFKGAPDYKGPAFVRQRTRVSSSSESGEPVIFETDEGIDIIIYPLAEVQFYDGASFTVVTSLNVPGEPIFPPFGWQPRSGSALYLGFKPPDTPLPNTQVVFPQRMRFFVFGQMNTVRSGAAGMTRADELAFPPISPVTLVWETRHPDTGRWRELTLFGDKSAGFTRDGWIDVQGPSHIKATHEGNIQDKPYFWLRCRIAGGYYPAGRTPMIDFIRPNVVSATSLQTFHDEVAGRSDGTPNQVFRLQRHPVILTEDAASFVLAVEDESGVTRWERRNDLLGSGREACHFRLNVTSGEVIFGDGAHGLIPPAGASIIAQTYRSGGGAAANAAAGTITNMVTHLPGVEKVTNERPAVGGKDEQSIDQLIREAPARLRTLDRAVTESDYETLAADVPGVAKAKAIAGYHPEFPPEVKVPGVITVLIVPDNDDEPPVASKDLMQVVARYLNSRRMLGTELHIVNPTYHQVHVSARVEINPYAASTEVERAIRSRLKDCPELNPRKQIFGQDFYPTRLYEVLRAPDVIAISHLEMTLDGSPIDLSKRQVLRPCELVFAIANMHELTLVPSGDK